MEKTFGKYTLLERLGVGGMAEVFHARLHGPGGFKKDIALKLILQHLSSDPEFVEMFMREATLAAKLDHANIVRIHEFDQIQGQYYIAMEMVYGKDLRKFLIRAKKTERLFSISEAVSIALEACKGLAFAHGELAPGTPEVIHRDISPHNIIVSKAGEVKINDFGIAKLASSPVVTKTGVIKGKAAYMSPEQSRGEQVDCRSDLFSLGCVLWELLTVRRLFSGESDMTKMKSLQEVDIHPPSKYNSNVPEELDSILLKLLARDPDQRYASAASVASDLEKIEGVGRSTLLSDLYRDLFPSDSAGTDRLHLVEAEDAEPEDLLAVETVGPPFSTPAPEIQTVSSEMSPAPPRKTLRLVITTGLAVAIVTGVLVVGIPKLLGEQETMPEPKPRLTTEAPKPPEEGEVAILAETKPPDPVEVKAEKETDLAPAPPKKPFGRLYLNAIPWAKVYRGKKYLGETPLENIKLPAGRHRLRLVNEELKVDKMVSVTVRKNKTTQKVFNLKDSE